MKKLLLVLMVSALMSVPSKAQQLPGLSVIATKGMQDYMKRSTDSLNKELQKSISDALTKVAVKLDTGSFKLINGVAFIKLDAVYTAINGKADVAPFNNLKADAVARLTSLESYRSTVQTAIGELQVNYSGLLTRMQKVEMLIPKVAALEISTISEEKIKALELKIDTAIKTIPKGFTY